MVAYRNDKKMRVIPVKLESQVELPQYVKDIQYLRWWEYGHDPTPVVEAAPRGVARAGWIELGGHLVRMIWRPALARWSGMARTADRSLSRLYSDRYSHSTRSGWSFRLLSFLRS